MKNGNDAFYSIKNTKPLRESPLSGRTFFFLGSSVTLGSAAEEVSFVDFLAKKHSCNVIKEAVSGTTLADVESNSYVKRLKKYFPNGKTNRPDVFLCQLSTNDTTRSVAQGTITSDDTINLAAFDETTTLGAIEWIIALVTEHWQCPVVFFTNNYFENNRYAEITESLTRIAKKWKIDVIDLFNDDSFNRIPDEARTLFLSDAIHPTKAGYREWWLPKFEKMFLSIEQRAAAHV